MGIGVSLLLVAVGAILTWAVDAELEGIDITVVGVILLVVGLIGLVLSFLPWSPWGGPGATRRRAHGVDESVAGPRGGRTITYVEQDDVVGPRPGEPGPPLP
ncbi:MAG: hypothetical protein H0V40_06445 [Actinobacteria bacterium]|nr:hypothetical protein [Actinomycetota bacterium]